MHIQTAHDTYLCFDSNKLFHGNKERFYISYKVIDSKIILMQKDYFIKIIDNKFMLSKEQFLYDMQYNENNTISISINGMYISSQKNGEIILVTQAKRWEQYYISSEDHKDILSDNFSDYKKFKKNNFKLCCCCGNHNYGNTWFCTDIFEDKKNNIHFLDITKKFPFNSDTFMYIY